VTALAARPRGLGLAGRGADPGILASPALCPLPHPGAEVSSATWIHRSHARSRVR